MKEEKKTSLLIFLIIIVFFLVGVIITYLVVAKPMPVALLSEYGLGILWEEGLAMNKCAECHSGEEFHGCDICHDDHGAVELAGVGFNEVFELTGDVPEPSFVRINELLPDQDETGTHITVTDVLAKYGVENFQSITLVTSDGGMVTIEYPYLDETALLVPYIDGIRFASENIHASAWMKGISKIIVVGNKMPLLIDGQASSIGCLLINHAAIRVAIEGTYMMLANESNETSHAWVTNWVEGVMLTSVLKTPFLESAVITHSDGKTTELKGSEVKEVILGIVYGEVMLILPERGRSAWLTDIIQIESK